MSTIAPTDPETRASAQTQASPEAAARTESPANGRSAPLTNWWRSRFGYRFLREVALLGSLLVCYRMVRYVIRGEVTDAFANARRVIDVERATGMFNEAHLQSLVLSSEQLVRFLNTYYFYAHFTVIIAFLLWMYSWRPDGYAACRRVLIAVSMTGMLIHVLYPLAPPRMFPEAGFVDTGALIGPSPYSADRFGGLANQFAAMPSLHFGWSVLVAYGVIRWSKSRLRLLVVIHPILTLAAIVMTANHYFMDAAVASALLLIAAAMDSRLVAFGRWLRSGFQATSSCPA